MMNNIFDPKGMPYMNEAVYKIVQEFDEEGIYFTEMSPMEYIEACTHIIPDVSANDLMKMRMTDKASFKHIAEAAEAGTLTIPVLDFKHNKQNGIHRAMWCLTKGIETIPVLVIEKEVRFDFEHMMEGTEVED